MPEDNTPPVAAEISYQRTCAPAPPNTVCCVQTAVCPATGSTAATACVRRPSEVSIFFFVPGCGAFAGTEYPAARETFSVESNAALPVPSFPIVNKVRWVATPFGWLDASGSATTYPFGSRYSTLLAGTGVDASAPNASVTPTNTPARIPL